MNRGVLYIVWGETIKPLLERSVDSACRVHPELPIHVIECDPARGLFNKADRMLETPFESTLFLDADTVVLGNLSQGFDVAEDHGLACCIGECPWLRRYGKEHGDLIEYNTGVLFFTPGKFHPERYMARHVLDKWRTLVDKSPRSKWKMGSKIQGLERDDQWAFSQAVAVNNFNPFVLPLNYNFRPGFHLSCFTPLKIWHSVRDVPPRLIEMSAAAENGDLISLIDVARPEDVRPAM